jgi:hypothetical protein
VHYNDGMLVLRKRLSPELFLDGTRPRIAVDGGFGALIHWCLLAQDHLSLHAAVLGFHNGSLLVLGDSGAGKSSLAAAWISTGRRIVTDDSAVLIPPEKPEAPWRAEPWRMDVGLRPDVGVRLFSSSATPLHGAHSTYRGKHWLHRAEHPSCFLRSSTVAGLVFLDSDKLERPRRSRAHRLSQAEALARLLYLHPILSRSDELTGRARASAVRLVSQLPAARLRVGFDLLENAANEVPRIEQLLTDLLPRLGAGTGELLS